jgi:hypothetical protein
MVSSHISAQDLIRTLSTQLSKNDIIRVLSTLQKVLENSGNKKELKKSNNTVRKLLIDPPLVETYLLQYFIREHVLDTSTGLNDFLYRPNLESKKSAIDFAILELNKLVKDNNFDTWLDNLVSDKQVSIKVKLLDGTEMYGNFTIDETIRDIKAWLFRRIQTEFFLGEAENPNIEFKDNNALIKDLNLHKKRLIIKIVSGDFGKSKIEETEQKRKEESIQTKIEHIEKYRKLKASKDKEAEDKKNLRAVTLQQFARDRDKTEDRISKLKI